MGTHKGASLTLGAGVAPTVTPPSIGPLPLLVLRCSCETLHPREVLWDSGDLCVPKHNSQQGKVLSWLLPISAIYFALTLGVPEQVRATGMQANAQGNVLEGSVGSDAREQSAPLTTGCAARSG